MAAVGVAAGVVIVLSRPSKKEQKGLSPVLRLKLTGQRAIASAGWRF